MRRGVLGKRSLERVHVIQQIATGCGDDRRADAEDVVAGDKRIVLLDREAKVIDGVPRRVERAQRGALGANNRTVGEGFDLDAESRIARPGKFSDRHRPETFKDLGHAAGMVRVPVGEDDALDGSAAGFGNGPFQHGQVLGHSLAGIRGECGRGRFPRGRCWFPDR